MKSQGIGIGGDHPLPSIITCEFVINKWRGAMMNVLFAMQSFGQFTAAIITLIVTVGFKESLLSITKASTCTNICLLAVDNL
jgi:PHS family inorganic phosphate transporter-like MFS transporter